MAAERLIAFGYPDSPRDPAVEAFIMEFIARELEPERVEAWVARVAEYVAQGAPDLASDPELATMLLDTVRDQWRTFVQTVLPAKESAQVRFQLVPSATAIAVEVARRRLDLGVLVNAYRMAQRAAWDYATGVVAGLPEDLDHAELLIRFWSAAGAWLDATVEQSILLHQNETRRIQQRGDAQRFDLVKRVLDGGVIEPREMSAGLGGYAVTGSHVAVILVADGADSIAHLEATAVRLAERLGAPRPLLVQPGGRELWCWVSGVDAARIVGLPGAEILPGIRVTVGGPHAGVDGFVAAYEDARRAQRLALAPRAPRVLVYDDVAAIALLAADPAAEAYVRRTLGKLASDEPAIVRLRETVAAYADSCGSVADVAERFDLHKNTVRYRLDQAAKLVGLPFDGNASAVGLAIAYYDALLASAE
ncbi:ABC transporter substrate-binding protein [Nocardioides baekrokdamisoli]|uniref:ABC transporter substrate-binding protein n=1 Tax=Nocardioides baekrokdamisoli TaxID=1804624 RepID=A0A3G9IBC1_9ACTN|nr:helix-turn-helix domain-containing protein [Nocardioides baekrokdamisoli]BBH16110.1 ABC transporter substrate-binding protein [Nocardioides baekrokdamisoli]